MPKATSLATQPATDEALVIEIAAAIRGADPGRLQWALDQLAALGEDHLADVLPRLPMAAARSERLVTVPTRGVFAEGKLGHCSVAEEIDNTGFRCWAAPAGTRPASRASVVSRSPGYRAVSWVLPRYLKLVGAARWG